MGCYKAPMAKATIISISRIQGQPLVPINVLLSWPSSDRYSSSLLTCTQRSCTRFMRASPWHAGQTLSTKSIKASVTPTCWYFCVLVALVSVNPDACIFTSQATVLLSTNVGLLAWSDNGKTGGINSPTPEQIITYISIICSVGSIIIGLAIFKQYRAKGADTPLRAVMPIVIDFFSHWVYHFCRSWY